MEDFQYMGLLAQHKTISLYANLCESPPALQVLRIALVSMCSLRVFPVPFVWLVRHEPEYPAGSHYLWKTRVVL